MNSRLSQDAADALQAYEQQQVWRQRVLADRAQQTANPVVSVWTPTISEQERQEREQQIANGALPF